MENCKVIEISEIISVETRFINANQLPDSGVIFFGLMDNAEKTRQPEKVTQFPTPQQMVGPTMLVNPARSQSMVYMPTNTQPAQNMSANTQPTLNILNSPSKLNMLNMNSTNALNMPINPLPTQNMPHVPPAQNVMMKPTTALNIPLNPSSQNVMFNPPTSMNMPLNLPSTQNIMMNTPSSLNIPLNPNSKNVMFNPPTSMNMPFNLPPAQNVMMNIPTSLTMPFKPPPAQSFTMNQPTSLAMPLNPPSSQNIMMNPQTSLNIPVNPSSQNVMFNPPTSMNMTTSMNMPLTTPSTQNVMMNPPTSLNVTLPTQSSHNVMMNPSTSVNMTLPTSSAQNVMMNPPTSLNMTLTTPSPQNAVMNPPISLNMTLAKPSPQNAVMNPPTSLNMTLTTPSINVLTNSTANQNMPTNPLSETQNMLLDPLSVPNTPVSQNLTLTTPSVQNVITNPIENQNMPINSPSPTQNLLIDPLSVPETPVSQNMTLTTSSLQNVMKNPSADQNAQTVLIKSTPSTILPPSLRRNSKLRPKQPAPMIQLSMSSQMISNLQQSTVKNKDIWVQTNPLTISVGTQSQSVKDKPHRNRWVQTDTTKFHSVSIQCNIDDAELSEPEFESDPIDVEENEKLLFENFVNVKSATYADNWSECLVCGEVCKFRKELERHMALHYGPAVLCHYCGITFEHHILFAGHKCKGKRIDKGKENKLKINRRVLCQHVSCAVIRVPSSRHTAANMRNRRRLMQICGHSLCNQFKKKRWFKRRISSAFKKLKFQKDNVDLKKM